MKNLQGYLQRLENAQIHLEEVWAKNFQNCYAKISKIAMQKFPKLLCKT